MILTKPSIDPIILSLGFVDIRWYSLAYIFENTAYISDTNDLSIVNIKELKNLRVFMMSISNLKMKSNVIF